MKPQCAVPIAALCDCVRCFEQREADLVAAPVVYPIAARPELALEFYFGERYAVRLCASGEEERVPSVALVGPCTYRRADLVLRGRLDVFTIQFQPAGFHHIFHVPMGELADRAYDARALIGPAVSQLEEALAEVAGFQDRVRIATRFLLRSVGPAPVDAVGRVANLLRCGDSAPRVDDAAMRVGLSVRQFERRFVETVGLPPKLYTQVVRFQAVLAAKLTVPARLWTEIAQEFGYYDQMHMVRNFKRFSGESPTDFLTRLDAMPEIWM